MDKERGMRILEGKEQLDGTETKAELIQLSMDAILEDDGNIWCHACNCPNECCTCGQEPDYN